MPNTQVLMIAAALMFCLCISATSEESVFEVEVREQAVPPEVPAHVKHLLDPKVYVISDDEGVCYQFWFAKAIPFQKEPDDAKTALEIMGEAFPVLGYVKIDEPETCFDFRDDPIDPGQYVIRGSFQPENGDHLGTSPAKSGFMLFMPKDKDDDELAIFGIHEEMWEESLADTAEGHPPILNLQPLESLKGDLPRIEEDEKKEWFFLTMNLCGKVGDKTFTIPVRLVIDGKGEM
ncbi:MAG: hypothetical protein QGG73_08910 [Candidatus Hydrogenedentes bacterium]|nr:hypothetical protein [Candidatus Hydrogenedentota bacterium]